MLTLTEFPFLNPGELCLAKWEDDVWYRVKVTHQIEDGSVSVLYYDYGNTYIVQQHQIVKSLSEVPPNSDFDQFVPEEVEVWIMK